MKKIVHVVDYLMPDMGYQEFLLPKWNVKAGYDVYIITGDRYTPVENYEETWGKVLGERICGSGKSVYQGVNIIRLPVLFEVKSRPLIKNLVSTIKHINPDLLYIHGTGSFSIYQCAFSFRNDSCKIFADNHMIVDVVQTGWIQKIYYFLHKFLMKGFISSWIDIFIGVTKDSCEYLERFEGISKTKIELLPLGVDTEIFFPNSHKRSDSFLVIQSGKLNDDKKPQWTSEAVLKLLKKGYDINLKFIGNGSSKIISDIKRDFSEHGFSERLKFDDLVPLKSLAQEYNAADLIIFPEGTSLSAIEAAACNKMVVMTDLPASTEREKNGIGKTYRRGDINDLSRIIETLVDDRGRCEELAKISGDKARNLYSYKAISEKMCNLALMN